MNFEEYLIVIPTFNEKENIINLIEELNSHNFHILVVDDNSPDGTYDLVANHNNFNNNIFAIKRSHDKGYGKSVIEGFKFGLVNNYKYIVQMDSDFSHRVIDLINMTDFSTYDLVIGSRYVVDGNIVGWKWHRKYLSKYANFFAKFVLNTEINDLTSGFRIYKSELLELINYDNITTNGYAFLVELINLILKENVKIIESPITFIDRQKGTSKMSAKIIIESVLSLLKIKKESN
jgi:dolichol-phosphate mannosyltransferase